MNKILIVALAIISLSLSTATSAQNLTRLISTPQNLQQAVSEMEISLYPHEHKHSFVKTGDAIAWLVRLVGIGISLHLCREDKEAAEVLRFLQKDSMKTLGIEIGINDIPFSKRFTFNDANEQIENDALPFTETTRNICFHYKIAFTMVVHLALYFYFSVWKKIEKRSRKTLIKKWKKLSTNTQGLGAHKAFFSIVPLVLSVGSYFLLKREISKILVDFIPDDAGAEAFVPLFTAVVCEHICYLLYFLIEIAPSYQGIVHDQSDQN